MTADSAPRIVHNSTGGTHEVHHLTEMVNQLAIQNNHATQVLFAKVFTGVTSAAAVAAATAGAATVDGDDCFRVPAGGRVILAKSRRRTYYAIRLIGSGATTTFTLTGTDFFD